MMNLEKLTTHMGVINIIQESANAYREIGTILLNDRRGVRVKAIERDEHWKSERIMKEIYQKWLAEDECYSWTTLTECLRDCSLNNLAYTIEQHFGLMSPQQTREGMISYMRFVVRFAVLPFTCFHVVCNHIQNTLTQNTAQ